MPINAVLHPVNISKEFCGSCCGKLVLITLQVLRMSTLSLPFTTYVHLHVEKACFATVGVTYMSVQS